MMASTLSTKMNFDLMFSICLVVSILALILGIIQDVREGSSIIPGVLAFGCLAIAMVILLVL